MNPAVEPSDEPLLRAAIALAAAAVEGGELPYGSLIADADGTILARAHNTVRSSGDITAHPELVLARRAASAYPPERRARLTLYTSCEPCPMCRNVIARAGIGRVVYALSTEQLHRLQPVGVQRPDAFPVHHSGPALPREAAAPVAAFYRP